MGSQHCNLRSLPGIAKAKWQESPTVDGFMRLQSVAAKLGLSHGQFQNKGCTRAQSLFGHRNVAAVRLHDPLTDRHA